MTKSDVPATALTLTIPLDSDDDVRALRGAILAARATELSEIQRRSQRHSLGYGTDSQRESMTVEVVQFRLRWTMLDRLLAAIERAANAELLVIPASGTAVSDVSVRELIDADRNER